MIAQLKKLPGVRAVLPVVNRLTILYAADKRKAKAVAQGIVLDQPDSISGFTLAAGDWPQKPNDIVVDAQLAASLMVKVGDEVKDDEVKSSARQVPCIRTGKPQ